jgi:hypothetical protein
LFRLPTTAQLLVFSLLDENYDPIFEKLDFKDGYSSW